MGFDELGFPEGDSIGQQLGQSEIEDEVEIGNCLAAAGRDELMKNRAEVMDAYSKGKVLPEQDLGSNLRREEIQLMVEGNEQSESRFDVAEQLEVELRFDLGGLDETHMLLGANGNRESHWGVDFLRQEQSDIVFQANSEENSSVIVNSLKLKEPKAFDSCQAWPTASSSHEDSHLFFDTVAQEQVSIIADAYDLKGRKLAEDAGSQEAGQPLIYTNQDEASAWINLIGKESVHSKVDVVLEDDHGTSQALHLPDSRFIHSSDVLLIGMKAQDKVHCKPKEASEQRSTIEQADLIAQRVKESETGMKDSLEEGKVVECRIGEYAKTAMACLEASHERQDQNLEHATGEKESGSSQEACGDTVGRESQKSSLLMDQHPDEGRSSDQLNSRDGIVSQVSGDLQRGASETIQYTTTLKDLEETQMENDSRKEHLQVVCDTDKIEGLKDVTAMESSAKLSGEVLDKDTIQVEKVSEDHLSPEKSFSDALSLFKATSTHKIVDASSSDEGASLRVEEKVVNCPLRTCVEGLDASLLIAQKRQGPEGEDTCLEEEQVCSSKEADQAQEDASQMPMEVGEQVRIKPDRGTGEKQEMSSKRADLVEEEGGRQVRTKLDRGLGEMVGQKGNVGSVLSFEGAPVRAEEETYAYPSGAPEGESYGTLLNNTQGPEEKGANLEEEQAGSGKAEELGGQEFNMDTEIDCKVKEKLDTGTGEMPRQKVDLVDASFCTGEPPMVDQEADKHLLVTHEELSYGSLWNAQERQGPEEKEVNLEEEHSISIKAEGLLGQNVSQSQVEKGGQGGTKLDIGSGERSKEKVYPGGIAHCEQMEPQDIQGPFSKSVANVELQSVEVGRLENLSAAKEVAWTGPEDGDASDMQMVGTFSDKSERIHVEAEESEGSKLTMAGAGDLESAQKNTSEESDMQHLTSVVGFSSCEEVSVKTEELIEKGDVMDAVANKNNLFVEECLNHTSSNFDSMKAFPNEESSSDCCAMEGQQVSVEEQKHKEVGLAMSDLHKWSPQESIAFELNSSDRIPGQVERHTEEVVISSAQVHLSAALESAAQAETLPSSSRAGSQHSEIDMKSTMDHLEISVEGFSSEGKGENATILNPINKYVDGQTTPCLQVEAITGSEDVTEQGDPKQNAVAEMHAIETLPSVTDLVSVEIPKEYRGVEDSVSSIDVEMTDGDEGLVHGSDISRAPSQLTNSCPDGSQVVYVGKGGHQDVAATMVVGLPHEDTQEFQIKMLESTREDAAATLESLHGTPPMSEKRQEEDDAASNLCGGTSPEAMDSLDKEGSDVLKGEPKTAHQLSLEVPICSDDGNMNAPRGISGTVDVFAAFDSKISGSQVLLPAVEPSQVCKSRIESLSSDMEATVGFETEAGKDINTGVGNRQPDEEITKPVAEDDESLTNSSILNKAKNCENEVPIGNTTERVENVAEHASLIGSDMVTNLSNDAILKPSESERPQAAHLICQQGRLNLTHAKPSALPENSSDLEGKYYGEALEYEKEDLGNVKQGYIKDFQTYIKASEVLQVNSHPQIQGDQDIRNVHSIDSEETAKVIVNNAEIQENVSVKGHCKNTSPIEGESPAFHPQDTSEFNVGAIQAGGATETQEGKSRPLHSDKVVPHAENQVEKQRGVTLQGKDDKRISSAVKVINQPIVLDNQKTGSCLPCSGLSDEQALQGVQGSHPGGRIAQRGSKRKKLEAASKSPFCDREHGGISSGSVSIVCELNTKGPDLLQHRGSGKAQEAIENRGLLAEGSLSKTGGSTNVPVSMVQKQSSDWASKQLEAPKEPVSRGQHGKKGTTVVAAVEPRFRGHVLDGRQESTYVPASSITSPTGVYLKTTQDNPRASPFTFREGRTSLPDLNIAEVAPSPLVSQPFNDSQQVQLRAQILVYGSLIQGSLPEEALMIAAFADIPGAVRQEAGRDAADGGGLPWKKAWRTAAERLQSRPLISALREPLQTCAGLQTLPSSMSTRTSEEGARTNGRISTSSSGMLVGNADSRNITILKGRMPETTGSRSRTSRAKQNSAAASGRVGNRNNSGASLNSPHPTSVSSIACPLPSIPIESMQNPQAGRSSQADSQQVPSRTFFPAPQPGPFVPGSAHWFSPFPFPGPWITRPQATGFDSSVPFTTIQPFGAPEASQEAASRSMPSPRLPFVPVMPVVPHFPSTLVESSPILGSTATDMVVVQKSNSAPGRQPASESRSRKRKKSHTDTCISVDIVGSGGLPTTSPEPLSFLGSRISAVPSVSQWCLSSCQAVTSAMSGSLLTSSASPESLAMVVVTSQASSPIMESDISRPLTTGSPTTVLTTGLGISEHPVSQYLIVSATEHQEKPDNSHSAMAQLEKAKLSAEAASSMATSAVRHSESVWSRLQAEQGAGIVSDKEARLASSAVAIAAAASVAKAAAAAARVAYEAALQAKLMGEEALKPSEDTNGGWSSRAGSDIDVVMHQQSSARGLRNVGENENNSSAIWQMTNSCKSIIATAKEVAKQRLEAASAATMRAYNLESVVKAADLVASAISNAGAVVAMGEPLPITLSMLLNAGPEGFGKFGTIELPSHPEGEEKETEKRNGGRSPGKSEKPAKGKVEQSRKDVLRKDGGLKGSYKEAPEGGHQIPELEVIGTLDTPKNKDTAGKEPMDKEIGKDSKDDETCLTQRTVAAPDFFQNEEPVALEAEFDSIAGNKISTDTTDEIKKGSLVEVLSDEEGLRGVWFSARVLWVENGKVLVVYDELLSDDGPGQLEEWIDLEGPAGEAPGVRLAHPMTRIKFEGTRKRRRAAMGNNVWSIGDRVDAWIRDGWWEGVVLDRSEEEESKVKVFFPGEGDTAFIKSWNLRPSLVWEADHWVLWSDSKLETHLPQVTSVALQSGTPAAKRQRLDKEQSNTLNIGMEKTSGLGSEVVQKLQGNNVKPPMESNRHESTAKTYNKGGHSMTDKVDRETSVNEGSKVVFGVPKPTKRRKFIEVSKHYASSRVTRSSPEGKAKEKIEKPKVFTSEFRMGSTGVSKGEHDKVKKKIPSKQLQSKVRREHESTEREISKNLLDRNDKEKPFPVIVRNDKPFPGFGMGTKKGASGQETGTAGPPSIRGDGGKSVKRNIPSDGHPSDAHRSNVNASTTVHKDTAERRQPTQKNIGISTASDRAVKDKALTIKDHEKEKNSIKSAIEALEPRRTSRRIQPTSKLLEGLQSTPNLGKNSSTASLEKGSRVPAKSFRSE